MGVKLRAQMRVWRELIPTRFALARKPTSPFQGCRIHTSCEVI
jgi:hypothetical protein